jgi:hypothetical protein
MARVVFVHGIGAQSSGGSSMTGPWLRAMNDGLALTGAGPVPEAEVGFAFYGDLFRPPGEWLSLDVPFHDAADVDPGMERELLAAWWQAAAEVDPEVTVPGADSLVAVPGVVQQGLYQLSRSRFFAGVAERVMIWNLKQVHRYFTRTRAAPTDPRPAPRAADAGYPGCHRALAGDGGRLRNPMRDR